MLVLVQAMKHVGKEPFNLFVDPKPDSDAAKESIIIFI